MIDATPEKKVVKINATVDDDINLILDAIVKVDAAFVMLILPEGNDLANSPIGLKALRKKTFEKAKRMVLVVPHGISYELAKRAGFIASTAQESVTNDVWQTVIQQYDEYYQSMVGMNSKKELPRHLDKKVEYMNPIPEHLPVPVIVSGDAAVLPVKEEVKAESVEPKHVEEPKEEPRKERSLGQNVTGMDFSKLVRQEKPKSFFGRPTNAQFSANTVVSPQEINTFHPEGMPQKVGNAIAKVNKRKEASVLSRFIGFSLIGAVVAAVGIFGAYYMFFPRVRIELQIQSNSITMSDTVLATSAVTGFDVNKKEIQMTKEVVEKNGSLSFDPTEKGTDGTKATGTITVINSDPGPKTVPVGTLVSADGVKFVVTGAAVVINGVDSAPMSITASDIGEEGNMPKNTIFAITGFSTLTGKNDLAFTGGSKRTFNVVGQKDVDAAVKELQTELAKQATSDLSYLNLDKGFTYIPESVKTVLKGKATVTPAVGTEVKDSDTQPSVSIFITTTALYYHSESLSQLAQQLLLDKYRLDKNISADDLSSTSIEELSVKTDSITLAKDDKITIKFTASGLATSKLDTEKIRNDIASKKWPEMLEYLSKLPALAKAPEVKFFPSWLPEFARYVPKEVSRIDVSVKIVAPEAPVTQ